MKQSLIDSSWNLERLQALQTQSLLHHHNRLHVTQQASLQAFVNKGFPTRRDEQWKYTNVAAIAAQSFAQATHSANDMIDVDSLAIADTNTLVFVNGHYLPQHSRLQGLSPEVMLLPLDEVLEQTQEFDPMLLPTKPAIQSPFIDLNAALMSGGLLIKIPEHSELQQPLHLLHINTNSTQPHMCHPRHLIIAEAHSQVTVFEEYVSLSTTPYLTNVVTRIIAKPHAKVHHYKLQREHHSAYHIAHIDIEQLQDSEVETFHVALGGCIARDDLTVAQRAPRAHCRLTGFYHANDQQHIDNHSRIDHRATHGSSDQYYKGILNGAGRAVFNGKVIVHEGAEKTKALQSNKNIVLTTATEVNTKPELEIYTDDVICSHGATVGQLDDSALFYLRSRGIEAQQAEHLLVCAFANELFTRMPNSTISAHLRQCIVGCLSHSSCEGGCIHG